jgi:NADPH:quinone reductase-like Zn-dependent oxidoreductase
MKAAIHTSYGPPEIVTIQDVPKPEIGENEVLIRIHYSTVNRTDCGFRSAEYFVSRFFSGLLKPKQQTLGSEFSGQIEAIGSHVSNFKKGDRIFGYNDQQFGAHAEFMSMKADGTIAIIPDSISYEDAAPTLEGAHYAWCDILAAHVKAGQQVLVYGASGAIGSAAVQLLNYLNAKVIAVCGAENMEKVKLLGAIQVIDYKTTDYTKLGIQFDFVFDAVGKTSFGKCKPVLTQNGIYISTELGKNGQNIWLALLSKIKKGKRVLFPLPSINNQDVEFFKELIETGKFKPVIDRTFSLDEIVQAFKYVETGQKVGNVLIKVID